MARKLVERTLNDVLASYKHVLLSSRTPVGSGPWTLLLIMFVCCILYNMILDDECDAGLELPFDLDQVVPLQRGLSFKDLVFGTEEIENLDLHYSLRGNLIEHNCALKDANMY
jgi:hypothetical protein